MLDGFLRRGDGFLHVRPWSRICSMVSSTEAMAKVSGFNDSGDQIQVSFLEQSPLDPISTILPPLVNSHLCAFLNAKLDFAQAKNISRLISADSRHVIELCYG